MLGSLHYLRLCLLYKCLLECSWLHACSTSGVVVLIVEVAVEKNLSICPNMPEKKERGEEESTKNPRKNSEGKA